MPPLSQKTALITGAAAPQGIGRAIALRLAALGADVVVTDIAGALDLEGARYDRPTLLEALAADLRAAGVRALALPLDVTDPADVQSAVTRTLSDFGRLDILVNNAGSLAGSDAFLSTTPAQWEASFRVNLLGPMMLSQAAIPAMQALGGGRIIMIGSTGSLGAEAGFGAYTAMKHGLVGLAKTLAAEFGKDGPTLCRRASGRCGHTRGRGKCRGVSGLRPGALCHRDQSARYRRRSVRNLSQTPTRPFPSPPFPAKSRDGAHPPLEGRA